MGNWSKSLGMALAGGLLCASSCVLPQRDDPLPFIPPTKNRPPRIILPTPLLYVKNEIDPSCPKPSNCGVLNSYVCARVEDFDVQDDIRLRWIVYEADGTPADFQVQDPPQLQDPQNTDPRRPRISATSDLWTKGSLASTSGGKARYLQLVVADGEFTIKDKALETVPRYVPGPDGGTIRNDTYLDSYLWVVETSKEVCPPP